MTNEVRQTARARANEVPSALYGSGVLRIVWARNSETNERQLVFAVVELLPHEEPPFETGEETSARLGGRSSWYLYARTVAIDVATALRWYESAVEGVWARPTNDGKLPETSPDGLESSIVDPVQEPTWPSMVVNDGSAALPFLDPRDGYPRLHHVLSAAPELPTRLSEAERALAVAEIEKWMLFDLRRVAHLWQSVHLVAHNPILRRIDCRLDSPDHVGDRAVLVTLIPRRLQTLNGLTVRVQEVRSTGKRLLGTFRPQTPFNQVPLGETVDQIQITVDHDELGLIAQEGPYTFMRSFSLQLGMVHRERKISTPKRKHVPAGEYRVSVTSPERPSITGHSPPMLAAQIFRRARQDTETFDHASGLQQRWFDGNPGEAAEVLRKIMGSARGMVRIVDPYFGAAEVLHFLPAIGLEGVDVQVLTSHAGLAHRSMVVEDERDTRLPVQVTALIDELARTQQAGLVHATTVRAMLGRKPPIHDRFLQVDESLWLLGSSLSEFGHRGTMLVKLPSPKPVLSKLNHAWDEAKPLKDLLVTAEPEDADGDRGTQ